MVGGAGLGFHTPEHVSSEDPPPKKVLTTLGGFCLYPEVYLIQDCDVTGLCRSSGPSAPTYVWPKPDKGGIFPGPVSRLKNMSPGQAGREQSGANEAPG